MVSLVIVSENEYLRLGLRTAIEIGEGIEVVGDCDMASDSIALARRLKPDVVLMSVSWSMKNEVAACREIRSEVPSTKVVMLSSLTREEELLVSILAGASGYVSITTKIPELLRAIRIADNGGAYFDRDLSDRIIGRIQEMLASPAKNWRGISLSGREKSILSMICEGCSNDEIGFRLNLATPTVRNNITAIRAKLGLDARAKLVAYAVRHGICSDSEEG